jgi:hypothetical protein
MLTITYDKWLEDFRPVLDPKDDSQPMRYDHQSNIPEGTLPDLIWTVVEAEDDMILVSGQHYVNRMYYYICEEAVPQGGYCEVEDY